MASGGYSFSPDSYLQRELEASFIYEDTPDQLVATSAIKEDMKVTASHGPSGVAVMWVSEKQNLQSGPHSNLLLTTNRPLFWYPVPGLPALSDIHRQTQGFSRTVEYLSRHRKPAEQKKIIADLESGKIDIIIGTHKLVGKNIRFRDLGLLIIDEEQRFVFQ